MLGWSIGFFLLAVLAGVFGFGGVASAFTGLAQVLFLLFVALFALSLLVGLITGGAHGGPALHGAGRSIGLLALVAIVAVGAYAWIDNGWTAERIGRAIDRRTAQATADASDAMRQVSDRTERFVQRSRDDLQRNTDELAGNDADAPPRE